MKSYTADLIIGLIVLTVGMLVVIGLTSNLPASSGTCFSTLGLSALIFAMSLWESGRQTSRWSDACAALGLNYAPTGGTSGTYNGRPVSLIFDRPDAEIMEMTVYRIEVQLKKRINGRFMITLASKLPVEMMGVAPLIGTKHAVQESDQSPALNQILSDELLREMLCLDETGHPLFVRLTLRDSKLVFEPFNGIWPDKLADALNLTQALAHAVETAPLDDAADNMYDYRLNDNYGANNTERLTEHGARIVSRRLM